MSKHFTDLNLGEEFSTGVSFGSGSESDKKRQMVYRKITKSRAVCIDQQGYGNKRSVGDVAPFSPYSRVFAVKEI